MATDMTGMKMAGSRSARRRHLDDAAAGVGHHRPHRSFRAHRCAPPDEAERAAHEASLERIADDERAPSRHRRWSPLARPRRTPPGPAASTSSAGRAGSAPRRLPPALNYKVDLTNYLTKLMCSARWSNGVGRHRRRAPGGRAAVPRRRGRRLRRPQGQHLPGLDADAAEGDAGSVRRRRERPLLSIAHIVRAGAGPALASGRIRLYV